MTGLSIPRGAGSRVHALLRALRVATVVALALAYPAANGADLHAADLARSVKAAYLYQFAGYVEWPPGRFSGPASPIVIGVMGDERLADELDRATPGRLVQARPIAVQRIAPAGTLAGLHVLYVASGATGRLRDLAPAVLPHNVLLVSDAPDGLAQGSVMNFLLVDDRIRFEASLDAARRAELRLSSRLLAVAYRVQGTPP